MLFFFILLVLLLIAAGALFLCARAILNTVFANRCEGNPNAVYYEASDFPDLHAEPLSFPSNRGQMLRGYMYSHPFSHYKGVIIFVHGMGAGHTAYTALINDLAMQGYFVFAYDATGTVLSDGASLGGFSQGFLDLKSAVSFIQSLTRFHYYPLFLVGHSWGAYTAANFTHLKTQVQGVIALSPFDSISSILVHIIQMKTGKKLSFLKPFFFLATLVEYHQLAFYRPSYSLQSAPCPVLILHGDQDLSVPLSLSPAAAQEYLKRNPLLTIQLCPGKGHNVYLSARAEHYMNEVFRKYAELEKTYKNSVPPEIRDEFFEHVDFRRMIEDDTQVMSLIQRFLEECLPEER